MKVALTIFALLALLGCSQDRLPARPTAPSGPAGSQLTYLLGKVVDESNACIRGATIQVVRGQGLGASRTQLTPCDVWSFEEGFIFRELTPGIEMTIRASAPDYAPVEKAIVPSLGEQEFVVFRLSRMK